MIIRIIWILIICNTLFLLGCIMASLLASNDGRPAELINRTYSWGMVIAGVLLILCSVIPLLLSHHRISLIIAGFFAVLPLVIGAGLLLSNYLPTLSHKETFAEVYYKDKGQRAIAAAIEQGDTSALIHLVKGLDQTGLNIQGTRVWDQDGLNYLQFAIRRRTNPISFPFNEETNMACIAILVKAGVAVNPALQEALGELPLAGVRLLLEAGADPNFKDAAGVPVLFRVLQPGKPSAEKAILLLQRGADPNAVNGGRQSPLQYASFNAGNRAVWNDIWSVVLFILEQTRADYRYIDPNGRDLGQIIREIRAASPDGEKGWHPDFRKVVRWLADHGVNTDPPAPAPAH